MDNETIASIVSHAEENNGETIYALGYKSLPDDLRNKTETPSSKKQKTPSAAVEKEDLFVTPNTDKPGTSKQVSNLVCRRNFGSVTSFSLCMYRGALARPRLEQLLLMVDEGVEIRPWLRRRKEEV